MALQLEGRMNIGGESVIRTRDLRIMIQPSTKTSLRAEITGNCRQPKYTFVADCWELLRVVERIVPQVSHGRRALKIFNSSEQEKGIRRNFDRTTRLRGALEVRRVSFVLKP
jgi:hypothetical protein